jgi:hypothetical protein
MNYFKGSLAELGESLGFKKGKVDFKTVSDTELKQYCSRDVLIMVKAWETLYHFVKEHNLGNVANTIAGQSFNAYRHRFMHYKILIQHDPNIMALERAAYHGGRVSVFWKGAQENGAFYKVDVNSMYPYVMQKESYPYQFVGLAENVSKETLEDALKEYAIIARVTVDTKEPIFVAKRGQHNVYPVGEFTTTLTTPELSYALRKGYIKDVIMMAKYKKAPIFKEYIDYFYPLKVKYKRQHNGPFYMMVKYYLNTLYGKFGQKSHQWKRVDNPDKELYNTDIIYNPKENHTINVYHLGDDVWTCEETGEGREAFPAIAAHVTAYARMYLYELKEMSGPHNCYYCDTDSLIVNKAGIDSLLTRLDDTKLGFLKVELMANQLTILAPKYYLLGDTWTRKGVPKSAINLGGETWEYDRFPTIRGIAKDPNYTTYKTIRSQKTMTLRIFDGIADETGWISPLDASEVIEKEKLTKEEKETIRQIQEQINAMKEARIIDSRTVFTLWDYRLGNIRESLMTRRDPNNPSKVRLDTLATELGYKDERELIREIEKQVKLDKDTAKLKREIYTLRNPSVTPRKEEIPF